MNVPELKQKYRNKEILPNSHVMLTGTILEWYPRVDKGQGWTFDPCKFGTGNEWARLSFKDAPSDGSLQQLQGVERSWNVEVKDYNGNPSLTVLNTFEQLHNPTPGETQVNADVLSQTVPIQQQQPQFPPAASQPVAPAPVAGLPGKPSLAAYRARRLRAVRFYYESLKDLGEPLRAAVALASGETIDLHKGVFIDSEPDDSDIPF